MDSNSEKGLLVSLAFGIILILLLCSCGPEPGTSRAYRADDVSYYDKSLILRNYGPDLDGDLAIFPEEITAKEAGFSARFDPNLFDTDGYMILECSFDKPAFDNEIIRLQGLSRTIEYEGEQFTNEVLYDEQSYNYPAYTANDGFGNTYEYALIDQAQNRIVYIYMAYPGSKLLKKYSDYVRKDLSSYAEENTMDRFSMYNHSFDGGESWVEYDDKVALIASGTFFRELFSL